MIQPLPHSRPTAPRTEPIGRLTEGWRVWLRQRSVTLYQYPLYIASVIASVILLLLLKKKMDFFKLHFILVNTFLTLIFLITALLVKGLLVSI